MPDVAETRDPAARLISPPGLFRVFLAYLVVVGHFTPIHLGLFAVYAFFMLSGFWVFKMWGKEYADTDRPYLNFVISRIWRLMPVYYLALFLWVVQDLAFDGFQVERRVRIPFGLAWSQLHFYVSHAFILGYATLPQSVQTLPAVWSLDVELQYYLVAPIVIGAISASRFAARKRFALYAVAFAGLVAYVAFYNGPNHFFPQNAFLPMFLIFFLVGAETARTNWRPGPRLALAGVATAVVFVAVLVALPETRELVLSRKVHGALADYNSIACAIVAFLCAPYAMAGVTGGIANAGRFAAIDRDLGNVSYEIYLLHALTEGLVDHYFGHLSRHARLPIITLVGILLLPACWFVYVAIDRPIDRRRAAWVRSRRRRAETRLTSLVAERR